MADAHEGLPPPPGPRMEEIERELAKMRESAPPQVTGRKPTEEEIAASRVHKMKIKSYLNDLPPDQRRHFTSSGAPMGVKGKQAQDRQKMKKSARRKPFPHPISSSRPSRRPEPVDYLCILDFEATCDDRRPAPRPQEIIEFPTLLFNVRTGEVEREFHHYIKPDVNPTLTQFCTELTGITQSMVDAGITLDHALALHREWIDAIGIVPAFRTEGAERAKQSDAGREPPTFLYLTCGDWDLKTCLPSQLHYHKKKVPMPFQDWLNVKHEFQHLYGRKAGGMVGMLTELGMELQGRHHSGIDDCRNIARICARMLEDGWVPGSASRNNRLTKSPDTEAIGSSEPGTLKERIHIGVVGTSRGRLVDKVAAREAVFSALDEVAAKVATEGREMFIVSGGGIVPRMAFEWASENEVSARQVVSASVRNKPKGVERMVFGTKHGEESKEFIKMVDVLVRVGGGPQSQQEVQWFRKIHAEGLVIEKELPLVAK